MNIGFILYDSRSGSTFLSKLLHEFDALYVTAESAFISRIIDGKVLEGNNVTAKEVVAFLNQEIHFSELKIDNKRLLSEVNSLISSNELTTKNLIQLLIKIQLKPNGKEKWILLKQPLFEHLNTIHEMFPKSKFIHIIRDPRGVHASKKKSINLQGKVFSDNVLKTSLKYRYKINMVLRFEERHNDLVHHIRYDDLLTKKDETLNKCLSFLNVINSKSAKKSYYDQIGANQKNLHTNVESEVIIDKVFSWKQELSKNEIAIISYFCSSIISYFDFEKMSFNSAKVKIISLKLYIRYIVTSIVNFATILFKNPELVSSKIRYLKTFFRPIVPEKFNH